MLFVVPIVPLRWARPFRIRPHLEQMNSKGLMLLLLLYAVLLCHKHVHPPL